MNNNPNNRAVQPRMKPLPLPGDYVQAAENAIITLKQLEEENRRNKVITSSKLRSLFSLFTELYNQVTRSDSDKLNPDQVNALNAAKVRIYYEIGREDNYKGNLDSASVGRFVKHTHLLEYLMDIGSDAEKLIHFYQYMEALVAFHRYYFGDR